MSFQVWAVEQEKTSEWQPPRTQVAKLEGPPLSEGDPKGRRKQSEGRDHLETEDIV